MQIIAGRSYLFSIACGTLIFIEAMMTGTVAAEGEAAWDVSGTWKVTQNNGYSPKFILKQEGTTLSGTGVLSGADQRRGRYTGNTGSIGGTMIGDRFDIVVRWAPKDDGQVVSGHYDGIVSDGRITGSFWTGVGPTKRLTDNCKNIPHSYSESGGCKCEEGYMPSKLIEACIPKEDVGCEPLKHAIRDERDGKCYCRSPYALNRAGNACIPSEGRLAEDIIAELETRIVPMRQSLNNFTGSSMSLSQLYQKPTRGGTEAFFNREVSLLPDGAMEKLRRRYDVARKDFLETIEQVETKLAAAKSDLKNEQYGSALILAQDAKALLDGAQAQRIDSEYCAVTARPTAIKAGAFTVTPGLALEEGCDCNTLDFVIMKRTIRIVGPVPHESFSELRTIPACRAMQGEEVNVGESLADIVVNDYYGKRGMFLVYWTSDWIYGEVRRK